MNLLDGDDYVAIALNDSDLSGTINVSKQANFNSINSESQHLGIFSQGLEAFSGESRSTNWITSRI